MTPLRWSGATCRALSQDTSYLVHRLHEITGVGSMGAIMPGGGRPGLAAKRPLKPGKKKRSAVSSLLGEGDDDLTPAERRSIASDLSDPAFMQDLARQAGRPDDRSAGGLDEPDADEPVEPDAPLPTSLAVVAPDFTPKAEAPLPYAAAHVAQPGPSRPAPTEADISRTVESIVNPSVSGITGDAIMEAGLPPPPTGSTDKAMKSVMRFMRGS